MADEQTSLQQQPITEHLAELRSCLIYSLGAVAVGFALSYNWIDRVGEFFFKPLIAVLPAGQGLIFTSYQEGFFFI